MKAKNKVFSKVLGVFFVFSMIAISNNVLAMPQCSSVGEGYDTNASEHRCMTSKGAVFESVLLFKGCLVGGVCEGWRDPDGKTWYGYRGQFDEFKRNVAEKSCAFRGDGTHLPSQEEFIRGNSLGLAEVFADLDQHEFWTSTLVPDSVDRGVVFGNRQQSRNPDEPIRAVPTDGRFLVLCVK